MTNRTHLIPVAIRLDTYLNQGWFVYIDENGKASPGDDEEYNEYVVKKRRLGIEQGKKVKEINMDILYDQFCGIRVSVSNYLEREEEDELEFNITIDYLWNDVIKRRRYKELEDKKKKKVPIDVEIIKDIDSDNDDIDVVMKVIYKDEFLLNK